MKQVRARVLVLLHSHRAAAVVMDPRQHDRQHIVQVHRVRVSDSLEHRFDVECLLIRNQSLIQIFIA